MWWSGRGGGQMWCLAPEHDRAQVQQTELRYSSALWCRDCLASVKNIDVAYKLLPQGK